jgi:DNA-directed RNA polymerase specialized sigma24 family protein
MSGYAFRTGYIRNGLSEVILGELDSWPELHRQIFVQSHYRGQSLEQVSHSCGMRVPEVRLILSQCERRLREALREFRALTKEPGSVSPVRPPVAATGGYLY